MNLTVLVLLAATSPQEDSKPSIEDDPRTWSHGSVLYGPDERDPSPPPAPLAGVKGWRLVEDPPRVFTVSHGDAFATTYSHPRNEVVFARLTGAELLFVNDSGFMGDPERRGYLGVPIALREGVNELLVLGAIDGFELELWRPETRAALGAWDVRWPAVTRETITWSFKDVYVPVFNASLRPIEWLHVHYGHATPIPGDIRPRVSEWRDGAFIAPLSQIPGLIYFGEEDGVPEVVEAEQAALPVVVYANDDEVADRRLLKGPLLPPGGTPEEPHPSRTAAALEGTLFQRILRERDSERANAALVYGTRGSDAQNSASLARARLTQQLLWYRTGQVPLVISDTRVLEKLKKENERPDQRGWIRDSGAFVLYGNRSTNAAWGVLVRSDSPVTIEDGKVHIGEEALIGEAISGWCLAPRAEPIRHPRSPRRPKSPRSVLVIGDTGPGARGLGYELLPLLRPFEEQIEYEFHRAEDGDQSTPTPVARGRMKDLAPD